MNRMKPTRGCMLILVCLIAFVANSSVSNANLTLHTLTETETMPQDLKLLKVHMATSTDWSDGWYTHEEMATAARHAGYDAIFFADNALQFGSLNLSDPGFQDVNASGMLEKWDAATSGRSNSVAYAGPLNLPPSSSTLTRATYITNERIRSGTHSLRLEIQSNGNVTMPGYAFVTQDLLQGGCGYSCGGGYLFNQTSISYPLLFGNITFTAYAWINSLGYAYIPPSSSPPAYSYNDNGWLFFSFNFTGPAYGPNDDQTLRLTVVYSDHPVDDYLRSIRGQDNDTTYKELYRDIPPQGRWFRIDINLSDLASRLWNQTIVDEWRLQGLEIGARSYNGGLVDVSVDDVSIKVNSSLSPLEYLSEMADKLSSGNFRVYPAYALEAPLQPSLYVYGVTSFGTNRNYNLTSVGFWHNFTRDVSSQGGIVVLGPTYYLLGDFIAANDAFGARFIDVTSFSGMVTAGTALDAGNSPAFAASTEAVSPDNYTSSDTWSVRVFAANNTEADILTALALGRAYMAVSNYTGSFLVSCYGFPLGINTVYLPQGDNASLTVYFTGLTPGFVRVYDGTTLVLKATHKGKASLVESLPVSEPFAHFFTALTGQGDSLAVVSNPLNFIQTSMIPGGALGIDNPQWALRISQWNSSQTKQQLELMVQGPAGTEANLYLYSPQYRPDASNVSQIVRYLKVGDSYFDPGSVYDSANSTFILSLKSNGQPIQIIFNFDLPQEVVLLETLQSVGTLYVLVAFPFATAFLYEVVRRFIKFKHPIRTRQRSIS